MIEDPKTLMALLGVLVPAIVALATLFVRDYLRRRYERWRRAEAYQPLINQITVKLGEISEQTHELHERQWEMPFDEQPVTRADAQWLESRFDQTAEVSKDAARALNDLARIVRSTVGDFEDRERIIKRRALDGMGLLLAEPSLENEDYIGYITLYHNQEYHFWAEHMHLIRDGVWQLAKSLYPHASSEDTRRDLASIGLVEPTGFAHLLKWFQKSEPRLGRKYSPEGI